MTAEVLPANAGNKTLTFTNSNPEFATIPTDQSSITGVMSEQTITITGEM